MEKQKKVKITVAMPAYNAARHITEAIESVISQDHFSFELVIIDDGSKDNTWGIMRRYQGYSNVRLYRNRKNRGVGKTRNMLVDLAYGEYVSPCDADDIMLCGNLNALSDFLDKYPRYGAVYADILVIEKDERGRITRPPYILTIDAAKIWDLARNPVNHAGSMIRKALIQKVGGYDERVYSIDDWALWLKLGEITSFKYLPGRVFYLWRRHPVSLTRTDKNRENDAAMLRREAIKRRYGIDI